MLNSWRFQKDRFARLRAGAIGVAALGLLCSSLSSAQPRVVELDRIVAVVNSDVIVETELKARVNELRARLKQRRTPIPKQEVFRRQVLEKMIVDLLQVQLAERTGITVEESALDGAIERIAQRNRLSLKQFRDVLRRDGYDYASFREQIRQEMLIARVRRQNVDRRITVSNREIENYLSNETNQGNLSSEYRLAHILIALPDGPSSKQVRAARRKGERALKRIRSGENFGKIAVAVSNGPNALKGGDLGWRPKNELPRAFQREIEKLRKGDVTPLLRSASGYHLFKLTATRGSDGRIVVNQTRAHHILIRVTDLTDDDDAKRRLSSLRERLVNGAEFAGLAQKHSEDTSSATRGGDLGWLNPGDTVPEFESRMNALSAGEISTPFRTQFGWHIVRVDERRQQDDTSQVQRTRAAEKIRARKIDDEYNSWLRQLRDEAYVELRLDEE